MFSISRVSSIAELPAPVAVCCHDAGAANLVAAWVADAPSQVFRICVEGPARKIFSEVAPTCDSCDLGSALDGAGSLLSGSGWSSTLEHRSRIEARRRGIPVLAVLDHWVNYRMRFIRQGLESLPDVLVVTDLEARRIAVDEFGETCPIVVWHNRYLEREVARVHAFGRDDGAREPHLLVALEPVRESWGDYESAPEFRALDFLLDHLAAIFPLPGEVSIRLRLHPSEPPRKYDSWIVQCDRPRLELSSTGSLARDLAWSDVAVGLHSYALVVALEAGRRALSYLPPHAPRCALRHERLEHLSRLIEGSQ